jgi:hypothetical protein
VVALDDNGAPNFASLQAALSEGRSTGLTYFVFGRRAGVDASQLEPGAGWP